ncbi:hypothetical protein JJQ72_12935 [Paenibacillus sp. F411]|uniref:hypothetical protein n=1 Tax=Paenibacillus sp. F411 TaxID=2820239 RepID=UPI001AAE2E08|nr:hypothetical protein [Paenibacillus sp. F411]MBO2944878.1 hypothetical protein [Paenibacillus sp. F411]
MNLFAVTSAIVYSTEDKHKVEKVIKDHGATVTEFLDLTVGDSHHYSYLITMTYDSHTIGGFIKDLNGVVPYITNDSFGFSIVYEEEEFKRSPLFNIRSIGNKADLYLQKPKIKLEKFCDLCNRKKYMEDQNITIDVNKLMKNPIMFVNHFFVVSENLANLLRESDLTGYNLIQVLHKGRKEAKIRGYQIMPTNVLPKQCIPDDFLSDPYILNQDRRCTECKLGGHRFPPYYYNPNDIKEVLDFNFTYENKSSDYVYRNTLVSRRVIDFFVNENYLINVVRNTNTWGEKDWVLEPILFNADC